MMKKGLLLGAGFSYDFGMPLAGELTDVFLGLFSKRKAAKLVNLLLENDPYGEDRPINKNAILEGMSLLLGYKKKKGSNYEEFLAALQLLGDSPGKSQSDRDSYHYLFGIFYEIIHGILTLYQVESYPIMYAKNLRWFSKFGNLLSGEETWVFTLNHDLYLECLATDLGIPVTYGDENKISFPLSNIEMDDIIQFSCSDRKALKKGASGFFNKENGINLVKLHGGLSELEYKEGTVICNQSLLKENSSAIMEDFIRIDSMAYFHQGKRIPSGRDRAITGSDGELDIIKKSMLTGGHKYSKTTKIKEGEEKLRVFEEVLKELEELTIIGYGFGDLHVNHRISNAMVLNDNLKLRIVDPMYRSCPEFLQQFDYDMRIRGALCGAPLWMDYIGSDKWNAEQRKGLLVNECFRLQIKKKIEAKIQ